MYHQQFNMSKPISEMRCTFSRANGPKVSLSMMANNPHRPYFQNITSKSLY